LLATAAMLSAVVGIEVLRKLFGFELPMSSTLVSAVLVGLAVGPLLLIQRAAGRRMAVLLGWRSD
jgi:hypothetical protein